jgi:hypothetical protein
VAEAQRAVRGVGARDLRESDGLRLEVATQLGRVRASLDAMLVDRPRRRIIRQTTGPGGTP